ncbi:hypothetical protein SDC9_207369 [bioreactor metagenome]|uniref:Uncharacterized protein n=1 Tax=bioreactor metagenome TaxID=1076179 RepID=A0A645J8D6_9ZZZZ
MGEAGGDISLRVFGHIYITIRLGTIIIENMSLSAGVWLLIETPVKVVQRIIVFFSDSLEEDQKIDVIPVSDYINSVSVSRTVIPDD